MKTITVTTEQLKNLGAFLSRVQLTGAEVPAFQEIVRALLEAKDVVVTKSDGKTVATGSK